MAARRQTGIGMTPIEQAREQARQLLRDLDEVDVRVEIQARRLGDDDPDVNDLRRCCDSQRRDLRHCLHTLHALTRRPGLSLDVH